MDKAIKLLVVDDSRIMRDAIGEMFADDHRIEVVGQASNGLEALEMVGKCQPDVITLDVAMPVMDGMTTLKHLMIEHPVPVVMLSSLTLEGAKVAFDALRYGAVDFISKPSAINDANLNQQKEEIRSKIEYAASVQVGAIRYIRNTFDATHYSTNATEQCENIISIGAAEGGYGALLKIIPHLVLDPNTAYLVTLYVAPEYIEAFASYLDDYSIVKVKSAQHDETIESGVCYLNSGMNYMTVHKQAESYNLHVSPAPFSSRKGAVDMLFFSTVETIGSRCTGVVLSGLGSDGAEGLEEIMRLGGTGIVQDPQTCLCKEMVNAVIERCDPEIILSDANIVSSLAHMQASDGSKPSQMAGLQFGKGSN